MRRAVFLENGEVRIDELEPRTSFPDDNEPTVWDKLDAAYQEGVDSV